MSLRKYARAEVIGIRSSPEAVKGASLARFASFDEYKTDDDFLYVRARAISSRVNANHDGWPTAELAGGKDAWEEMNSKHTSADGFTVESKKGSKTGFSTFIGKPIFVDHHNSDPKRARGVIVDSKFRVLDQKTASADDYWSSGKAHEAHLPASEVELLMEIDAKTFPKLAKAIVEGKIDGFSMGCDVDYTKCSHCGNEAAAPSEYCSHIQAKGGEHDFHESDGTKKSKKSYEDCYGPAFFEISAVFDPADETALTKEVISSINHEGEGKIACTASRLSSPEGPQDDLTHSPNPVHTLRDEKVCPLCGSVMDDVKCKVCGFEEPPKQFQNPDLSEHVNTAQPTGELDSLADPNPGTFGPTRNQAPARTVSSDGSKTPTPAMLTARSLIEAAAKTKEITRIMSDETKTAAEPADPVGKPDVKTDVTGQGGIVDASNEATSKPDKKEKLDAHATGDDSGFKANDKIKGTPKGTDTFDAKHQLPSAVSSKDEDEEIEKESTEEPEVEKESSEDEKSEKTAAEPVDPIGKADKRIDVTEPPHDQKGPKTETWTGTDGNGVTKQQNPVTDKASHVSIAAIQLVDAEIEHGITTSSQKYARLAELAQTPESEINVSIRTLASVKTARKASGPSGLGRVPSLSHSSSTTRTASSEPVVSQEVFDAALFTR